MVTEDALYCGATKPRRARRGVPRPPCDWPIARKNHLYVAQTKGAPPQSNIIKGCPFHSHESKENNSHPRATAPPENFDLQKLYIQSLRPHVRRSHHPCILQELQTVEMVGSHEIHLSLSLSTFQISVRPLSPSVDPTIDLFTNVLHTTIKSCTGCLRHRTYARSGKRTTTAQTFIGAGGIFIIYIYML